eukprot:633252-Pelagomonas_calceolata.AAC.1
MCARNTLVLVRLLGGVTLYETLHEKFLLHFEEVQVAVLVASDALQSQRQGVPDPDIMQPGPGHGPDFDAIRASTRLFGFKALLLYPLIQGSLDLPQDVLRGD